MTQERFRPTSKTALISHKGCLDGTGSALMFVRAGGLRENVIFLGPNGCELSANKAKGFDEVWFADLCPRDLADPAGGKPFRVFDHHISNSRLHGDHPACVFDMQRSGTSLMAKVLGMMDDLDDGAQDETFSLLVTALESYDLGRFDNPHGMRLADVASTYSQEEMLDLMLERDDEEILFNRDWTNRAEAMAAVRTLFAKSAAARAPVIELWSPGDNRTVLCAIASSPVYWKNDVATEILKRDDFVMPDSAHVGISVGPVEVAVIFDVQSGMTSLRSRPDGPDCSMIAAEFGGGGHARAAGFVTKGQSMLLHLSEGIFG